MNKNILIFLFIFIGILIIINPSYIINNIKSNYSEEELLKGWAIYSITIGLLLLYPNNLKNILYFCFISSIIWHLNIINKKVLTKHHKQSIFINLVAILITYNIKEK